MNWFCSQIGAREHYAMPRALHQGGKLDTLFTDFWAGPVVRAASRLFPLSPLRSLASRFHSDMEKVESGKRKAEIISWDSQAILNETLGKFTSHAARRTPHLQFIEVGEKFGCAVRDELRKRKDLSANTVFFGYDTGALEPLEWCQKQGIKCVVDQMDPNRIEVKLVQKEEKHWPGWALHAASVPEEYFKRREQEWALADRIVVNSPWSADALVQQGVKRDKLVVIPLCYEINPEKQKNENRNQFQLSAFSFSASAPLRVLFLGQVILRKGIQYLIEAAKLLQNEPVQFDVVGPIGISEDAIKSAPPNVTFHGRAARDEAARWYGQSDIFILPTISDGFAITQIEAMAHGLPVIATANCGVVVTSGSEGFIIPARDSLALAKALLRYMTEPEILSCHRAAALTKSKQFSLDNLGTHLSLLEKDLIAR
jgi:glycosyltransferase involved in cell wall biosynthesis